MTNAKMVKKLGRTNQKKNIFPIEIIIGLNPASDKKYVHRSKLILGLNFVEERLGCYNVLLLKKPTKKQFFYYSNGKRSDQTNSYFVLIKIKKFVQKSKEKFISTVLVQ